MTSPGQNPQPAIVVLNGATDSPEYVQEKPGFIQRIGTHFAGKRHRVRIAKLISPRWTCRLRNKRNTSKFIISSLVFGFDVLIRACCDHRRNFNSTTLEHIRFPVKLNRSSSDPSPVLVPRRDRPVRPPCPAIDAGARPRGRPRARNQGAAARSTAPTGRR